MSFTTLPAIWLVLAGAALVGVSGCAGMARGRARRAGAAAATALHVAGALAVLGGIAAALGPQPPQRLVAAWGLPFGSFRAELDGLSAAFMLPIVVVPALGAVYGLGSWSRPHATRLRVFFGTLAASLILVTVARDGVLFLLAWEAMALSAYFLITTGDSEEEAAAAGWVYLVATHVGTLALFALFALWGVTTGSFALDAVPSLPIGAATALFLLGVLGFGLKAGLMPLHVWLPAAHAAAPSHVSAVLSGVVLKIGVYGLARVTLMLPDPPAFWGALLLALGAVSGVIGVVFAIAQHDLKRLLAYHSIENIGIIAMGLGLAMLGRSYGRADLVVLGLGGAILHVWNHAFFKALLFFGAGAVVHELHTRDIDRMGGLARRMPLTSLSFLCGAVAICGLPPLNGFVSELLIALALLRTLLPDGGAAPAAAALALPALALIGALAVACFVKVCGAVFLGEARGPAPRDAREAGWTMLIPMALLVAACVAIGALPALGVPLLDRAAASWSPPFFPGAGGLAGLAPLAAVSGLAVALWAAAALGLLWLRRRMVAGPGAVGSASAAPRPTNGVGTWDCGHAAPTARMQYTASSLAQMLVALFRWALHPREVQPPQTSAGAGDHFPRSAEYRSHVHDVVLEEWVMPLLRWVGAQCARLRVLQTGRTQAYVMYILMAVAALVLASVPVVDLLRSIVTR